VSQIIPLFIAPFIFLVLVIIARAGMEKKDWALFMSSYFLGFVAVIPMVLAVYIISTYWLQHVQSIRRILFYSFIVIGFLSEFSKFLILRYKYISNDSLTKPFDGILYSVLISMGFATMANLYFYYEWTYTENLSVVLYTLPFANLLIGIIMGFFIGLGKFRSSTHADSITGLGAAMFFQGFFNFCLFSQDYLLLGLVAFGTLIICIMLMVKSLNTDLKSMM
jgi:RsiW-degrading membrane proteinase PrsW (M82 family)